MCICESKASKAVMFFVGRFYYLDYSKNLGTDFDELFEIERFG